eukprot:1159395-Pelagomonas_calceolata.AAC.2
MLLLEAMWQASQIVTCAAGAEQVPAGGIVTGIGQVHGRLVAIAAQSHPLATLVPASAPAPVHPIKPMMQR